MFDTVAIPKDFNDKEREILTRALEDFFDELRTYRARSRKGSTLLRANVDFGKVRGHRVTKEVEGGTRVDA